MGFKSLFELSLIILLGWFGLISYNWIKINGISDSNSIIAIGTIVYAIFTFFMFWNMKSSSEAQTRPLLITTLDEEMRLHISNKIKQNVAKNVKLRIRAVSLKKGTIMSKFAMLKQMYLFGRAWNLLRDYFKSVRHDFEFLEGDQSVNIGKYLAEILPFEEKVSEWGDISIKGKSQIDELEFKLLVYLSYESLLDINYNVYETYFVRIDKSGTTVLKSGERY
ncbi:Uncharacterised protein [uncultured archaeon]|nr:Uncharacterised protein [uncultured archaeon]